MTCDIREVRNILLRIQKNFECAICLDLLEEPLSTKCSHQFCKRCILRVVKDGKAECPLCKERLSKRSLNDNKSLAAIVASVKHLVDAVRTDTGAICTPPLNIPSDLTGTPGIQAFSLLYPTPTKYSGPHTEKSVQDSIVESESESESDSSGEENVDMEGSCAGQTQSTDPAMADSDTQTEAGTHTQSDVDYCPSPQRHQQKRDSQSQLSSYPGPGPSRSARSSALKARKKAAMQTGQQVRRQSGRLYERKLLKERNKKINKMLESGTASMRIDSVLTEFNNLPVQVGSLFNGASLPPPSEAQLNVIFDTAHYGVTRADENVMPLVSETQVYVICNTGVNREDEGTGDGILPVSETQVNVICDTREDEGTGDGVFPVSGAQVSFVCDGVNKEDDDVIPPTCPVDSPQVSVIDPLSHLTALHHSVRKEGVNDWDVDSRLSEEFEQVGSGKPDEEDIIPPTPPGLQSALSAFDALIVSPRSIRQQTNSPKPVSLSKARRKESVIVSGQSPASLDLVHSEKDSVAEQPMSACEDSSSSEALILMTSNADGSKHLPCVKTPNLASVMTLSNSEQPSPSLLANQISVHAKPSSKMNPPKAQTTPSFEFSQKSDIHSTQTQMSELMSPSILAGPPSPKKRESAQPEQLTLDPASGCQRTADLHEMSDSPTLYESGAETDDQSTQCSDESLTDAESTPRKKRKSEDSSLPPLGSPLPRSSFDSPPYESPASSPGPDAAADMDLNAFGADVVIPEMAINVNKRTNMSFLTSGLSTQQMARVKRLADLCGCRLAGQFNRNTTHVIVYADEDHLACRTLKYLQGIAAGKWLVRYQWVEDALREGAPPLEDEYEVRGDNISKIGGAPRGARLSQERGEPKLLSNYKILLSGTFETLEKDHAHQLVDLSGAQLVTCPDSEKDDRVVIVYDPEASPSPPVFSSHPCVTIHWLTDSLAAHQVLPLKGYHNDEGASCPFD